MRRIVRFSILLMALTLAALAIYLDPTFCVRGWLHGEAFYDGRPTSYWRHDLQQWEDVVTGDCLVIVFHKRKETRWQQWCNRWLPSLQSKREEDLRFGAHCKVFEGDVEALPVVWELFDDPDPEIKEHARKGLEKIAHRFPDEFRKSYQESKFYSTPD